MTDHIDEFESIFRRAEKEQFAYVDVPIDTVTLVSDGSIGQAESIQSDVRQFIGCIDAAANWHFITADDYRTVAELSERIDAHQTDLVITHRHLHEESFVPQHSLGVYLDVLTQTTSIPVLVLPGTSVAPVPVAERDCNRVMVVADHISGDNRLINYGAVMCRPEGTVWLCHVEDALIFERYMRAIGRVPEIDTDQARILLENQFHR
jgi:hypothetical protein